MEKPARTFAILVCLFVLPLAASAQTFTGTLNVVWEDSIDGGPAGGVRYILATPDGRYVPMQVTGLDANTMLAFDRRPIVVNGVLASRPSVSGTGNSEAIVVESIALNPAAAAAR